MPAIAAVIPDAVKPNATIAGLAINVINPPRPDAPIRIPADFVTAASMISNGPPAATRPTNPTIDPCVSGFNALNLSTMPPIHSIPGLTVSFKNDENNGIKAVPSSIACI